MPKLKDFETHLPPVDYENPLIREERIPREETVPKEEKYSFDEDNRNAVFHTEESKRKFTLKDFLLKPLVSVVAVSSIVFASLGIDPLGMNIFGISASPASSSATESSASPATPADTAAADTETGADTTDATPPEDEDEFPALGNLNPDFAGDYAWSTEGSEEYVRFARDGDTVYSYLVKGGAWNTYDAAGKIVDDSSAVYDKASNKLTLTNFTASVLDVNLMGNSFTIELVGTNNISGIQIWGAMYAGSLTLTGNGSLTVGSGGLILNCEGSESCLIVTKGVTLDVTSANSIIIGDTTMTENAIFLSKSLELTGGKIGKYGERTLESGTFYSYAVLNDEGEPAGYVRIEPKK